MRTTPLFIGDENGLRDAKKPDMRTMRVRSDFDPEFAEMVKRRRVALDMTQAGFSAALGIHPVTLSRLETATYPLTKSMREKIIALFERLER